MRYGSVCSGIEAATVAWRDLGWQPAFFSEIDKFPRKVLEHHYPNVPLHGDFTTIKEKEYGSIELLVGGTPCQSFSIAGLRGGLDDDRGNLALEYLRLAQRETPQWLVWENVPGVLSSNSGRDFGAFLGALAELGYGFAYRVLDAQYFGVAQRRRRVFVVGYLGDWRCAAQVLFERDSLSGNPAPSREPGEKPAPAITHGPPFSRTGNERVEIDAYIPAVARCLTVKEAERQDYETCTFVSQSAHNVMPTIHANIDRKWGSSQWVNNGEWVLSFQSNANACDIKAAGENVSPSMLSQGDPPAVCFAQNSRCEVREMPYAGALAAETGAKQQSYVHETLGVRRLTPVECERLQGFPDGYTKVGDKCYDGPRYKALGNSMAVPVMRWIGERINQVSTIS